MKVIYDPELNRFLTAGADGKILAWDEELRASELGNFSLPIDGFERTREGKLLVALYRQDLVRVLDKTAGPLLTLRSPNRSTPVLTGDGAGLFFVGGEARSQYGRPKTFLWDGEGKLLHAFDYGFPTVVEHLDFSSDNRYLGIGSHTRYFRIPVNTSEIVRKHCEIFVDSLRAEGLEWCPAQ